MKKKLDFLQLSSQAHFAKYDNKKIAPKINVQKLKHLFFQGCVLRKMHIVHDSWRESEVFTIGL